MNDRELERKRNETEKHYHVPGCAQYMHRKRSAVFFNTNNTPKHEMAKALGAYMLSKWGDIKFSDSLIEILNSLDLEVKLCMKGFEEEGADWVTEAVPNETPNRRVDLVNLDNDTRIEFECDKKISKGDDVVTIYL